MKRKGFTLIELVVVVAIILVLAATLAPKLRNEVAKARDAKVVAALGSVRTAINVYYADKEDAAVKIYDTSGDALITGASTAKESEYLETSLIDYLSTEVDPATDAVVKAGGSKESADGTTVIFGGTVGIDYDSSEIEAELSLASMTAASATTPSAKTYDTKGNDWTKY